jgi:hypothetical protein
VSYKRVDEKIVDEKIFLSKACFNRQRRKVVLESSWFGFISMCDHSGGNSLFLVGGQSRLNFRQNFQISDKPPPFALEKAVFSPLLGQNFRKFLIPPPRPTKISATV